MEKENRQDKEDIESWLLGFEKLAGRPVVISLLVEDGNIDFVSVVRKKLYLSDESEDPDETPSIDFEKAKETKTTFLEMPDYIG